MGERLAGKSIVVTGDETGIGRSIVLRCLDEGASRKYYSVGQHLS